MTFTISGWFPARQVHCWRNFLLCLDSPLLAKAYHSGGWNGRLGPHIKSREVRAWTITEPVRANDQLRYNGAVAESLKVDKEQFEAVMRALLSTPPTPASEIAKKPKAKNTAAKK